jgi:TetR/AcrR family transcriptional repressor of nem operon
VRYDAAHKAKTRDLVLTEASRALKESGPDGVSVADIMKRAGLTHGGFYAHFSSKDDLIAAAIERMFESSRERWAHETLERPPAEGLGAYIDWYLSPAHRDSRAAGCPMAALAADVPRMSPACREAFTDGLRRLTTRIEALIAAAKLKDAPALASSVVSELVGALSLARLESDRASSDAILERSRLALRRRLAA